MNRLRPQIHNLVLILNRRSLKTNMKTSNWIKGTFLTLNQNQTRLGCKPQRPCSKAESALWRRRDDDEITS